MSEPTDPQLRDLAVQRLRLYADLIPHYALGEIAYDERFRSEEWPRPAYHPNRDDLVAVLAELDRLTAERDAALGAVERTVQMMHDYNTSGRQRGEVFAHVNCRQVIGLLSLTWPDGNYEGASDAR